MGLPLILESSDIDLRDDGIPALIGGKAAGLVKVRGTGLKIPRWSVLTAEFFRGSVEDSIRGILRDSAGLSPLDTARVIRESLTNHTFDRNDEQILAQARARLGAAPIMVRSSAVAEDMPESSLAGMYDSVAGVSTETELAEAVRRVWASVFSERTMASYAERRIQPWSQRMAVILQRMVPARVSGIAFSNRGEVQVTATRGLGDKLAAGSVDGDEYVVDGRGRVFSRGPHSPLRPSEVRQVYRAAGRLRTAVGGDVNVEFAFRRRNLYLLQCRPVTVPLPPEPVRTTWDNANIIESYAGTTTPLTFSFIRDAYSVVYRQFCETMGVSKREVERNAEVFDHMLGFIHNHVYYNLSSWYSVVKLLPGVRYNRGFMEQMMGARAGDSTPQPQAPWFDRFFHSLPRLLVMAVRMLAVFFSMRSRMRRFFTYFNEEHDRYRHADFDSLDIEAIRRVQSDLRDRFLAHWRAPIVNDLKAMVFHGIYQQLVSRWLSPEERSKAHSLLAGQGGMRSVSVATELRDIASSVRDDQVRDLLNGASDHELMSVIAREPACESLHGRVVSFLDRYGSRCAEELKLESASLRQDPTPALILLRSMVAAPSGKPRGPATTSDVKDFGMPFLRRWAFCLVLRHARQAIRDRENQRLCRSQIYDVARRLVRAVGARWSERGIIQSADDIFYLELDELSKFADGTAVFDDVRTIVAQRKAQHAENQNLRLPDRFQTTGEVGAAPTPTAESADDAALLGRTCYPGRITGKALVLTRFDPAAPVDGRVLVARQTDPGWILLYPRVSGLVVERGSLLSHTAIIARELRIPCVVGVRGATERIKDGDTVVLDAGAGTVVVNP